MSNEQLNYLTTKEDFLDFLQCLKKDNDVKFDKWINKNISSYIEAISWWIEDMEGYYENVNIEIPQNINWNFIATLFYVGKFYE